MPLDLFPGQQREADAFIATRPGFGPGLDPSFGESFGEAWGTNNRFNRDLRMDQRRHAAVQDWVAKFEAKTGVALPNPETAPAGFGRDFFYKKLADTYASQKAADPELDLPAPPTPDDAHKAAIADEQRIARDAAAVGARPQTFASGSGTMLGGVAAVAADPINLASMVTPMGEVGIVAFALKAGAITAGSQAVIEGVSFRTNREINPNYGASEIAMNIAGAGIGGAALGGGMRALGAAWARLRSGRANVAPVAEPSRAPVSESAPARPAGVDRLEEIYRGVLAKDGITGAEADAQTAAYLASVTEPTLFDGTANLPRYVRDAGNVVERQAAVNDASPYKSAGADGEVAHTAAYKEAEAAVVEGRAPVIENFAWRPGKVFAADGKEVGVKYEVVEADTLVASQRDDLSANPNYPEALQPRDRTRAASAEQIAGIASKLEPARLGPSPDAATGAPIVGPDNVVESGNGRVLAIRRAYQEARSPKGPQLRVAAIADDGRIIIGKPGQIHADLPNYRAAADNQGFVTPEGEFLTRAEALQYVERFEPEIAQAKALETARDPASGGIHSAFYKKAGKEAARATPRADAYRDYLSDNGIDTRGMRHPVLIARRTSVLSDADRADFTASANRSSVLRMSAPEQALADARLIDGPTLEKLTEGAVDSADNRVFVRGFLAKLPKEERGGMVDRTGALSTEGIRRVESALLARAYGEPALLSRILESPDNNIKALGGALTDSAGRWTAMRDATTRGDIPAGMDITRDLLDAMRLVTKARDSGQKLEMLVDQAEMFAAPSPITRALLKLMFRDDELTKPASRAAVARGLNAYAEEAGKNTTDARLFGDALTGNEVLDTALKKAGREDLAGAAEQATLPLTARETLAKSEVDDAVIHQLEHLREESPDLMVPMTVIDDLSNESVTLRPVKELIDEADAEIKAAKEIEACASGEMLAAAE